MCAQIVPTKGEQKPAPRRVEDIFDTMRREIDTIFDRWLGGPSGFPSALSLPRAAMPSDPRMDVTETASEYVIEAELPGVDEKDVSVTIQNGIVSLRGEKKQEREEKTDNYHLTERSFGSFERAVRLPETADQSKVDAQFTNGVLRIAIAKRADAIKPERRIEIKKG